MSFSEESKFFTSGKVSERTLYGTVMPDEKGIPPLGVILRLKAIHYNDYQMKRNPTFKGLAIVTGSYTIAGLERRGLDSQCRLLEEIHLPIKGYQRDERIVLDLTTEVFEEGILFPMANTHGRIIIDLKKMEAIIDIMTLGTKRHAKIEQYQLNLFDSPEKGFKFPSTDTTPSSTMYPKGLIITQIKPGSIYERLELKNNDTLLSINNMPCINIECFSNLNESNLTLQILRDGKQIEIKADSKTPSPP
jgi:hypothetical protein